MPECKEKRRASHLTSMPEQAYPGLRASMEDIPMTRQSRAVKINAEFARGTWGALPLIAMRGLKELTINYSLSGRFGRSPLFGMHVVYHSCRPTSNCSSQGLLWDSHRFATAAIGSHFGSLGIQSDCLQDQVFFERVCRLRRRGSFECFTPRSRCRDASRRNTRRKSCVAKSLRNRLYSVEELGWTPSIQKLLDMNQGRPNNGNGNGNGAQVNYRSLAFAIAFAS